MNHAPLCRTLLLLCLCSFACAADPGARPLDIADQGAPAFQVFGPEDGLSDEIWSTVGFDADGFVWAGSASGLARFDGYRFSAYSLTGARSLVRDMASAPDGSLWAIFEREGLARMGPDGWQLIGERRFAHRFSVGSGSYGQPYLYVSQEQTALRYEAGQWVPIREDTQPLSGQQISLAHTDDLFGAPRLWNARNDGTLWYRHRDQPDSTWQRFAAPQLGGAQFTDLLRTHHLGNEELWLLTYGGGVLRIDSQGQTHWPVAEGALPSSAVYSAQATHDEAGKRRLWLATRGGLVLIEEGRTRVFDRRHGLPSNALRGLRVQRNQRGEDVLWMATEGGIARMPIRESPWQTVSLLGSTENGVFGVLVEPDDAGGERLWVGSARDGLQRFDRDGWRTLGAGELGVDKLSIRGIWRLPTSAGGHVRLIGQTDAPPVLIDDAMQASTITPAWPNRPAEAVTSAVARPGAEGIEWWVGLMHGGAWRQIAGRWEPMLVPEQGSQWSVLGMVHDEAEPGTLWLATSRGLLRWRDGSTWAADTHIAELRGMSFRHVAIIKRDGRRELWASSGRNGVQRLLLGQADGPHLIQDDTVPAPPDPTVYSALPDSQGRIYVCTNNGVQQLIPTAGGYAERTYRRRDGLVHDECNSGGQQVDAHDRFWVGTLGGLSMYDPALHGTAASRQPSPLRLLAVLAEGQRLPGQSPEVPPGNRDLRIEFSLLSGQRESESRFRSRLSPYEEAFSEWSASSARTYGVLPPGDYLFEVQAKDFSEVAAAPLSLSLRVIPHWWQQAWAAWLFGALLLFAGIAIAKIYTRDLRRRQQRLEQAVQSRTQELHQANERLVELSYLDQLTQLPNRRRLMEALAKAIERARERDSSLGLILIDVDHFKRFNDRHGHLAGDSALRAVARALGAAKRERDLVARYGGEEFVCLMEDVSEAQVAQVAERMRERVASLPPREVGNDEEPLSLSAGYLARVPGSDDSIEQLLKDADTALYVAKRMGRNQSIGHGG